MSDPVVPQPPASATPPQPPAANDPVWTPIGKAAEWPENGGRLVKVGARRIGVYHHQGKWFALKDMCPHAGVSLVQGPIKDNQVMCVGHGWLFSLVNGECTRGPTGVKVAPYEVRVSVEGAVEVLA